MWWWSWWQSNRATYTVPADRRSALRGAAVQLAKEAVASEPDAATRRYLTSYLELAVSAGQRHEGRRALRDLGLRTPGRGIAHSDSVSAVAVLIAARACTGDAYSLDSQLELASGRPAPKATWDGSLHDQAVIADWIAWWRVQHPLGPAVAHHDVTRRWKRHADFLLGDLVRAKRGRPLRQLNAGWRPGDLSHDSLRVLGAGGEPAGRVLLSELRDRVTFTPAAVELLAEVWSRGLAPTLIGSLDRPAEPESWKSIVRAALHLAGEDVMDRLVAAADRGSRKLRLESIAVLSIARDHRGVLALQRLAAGGEEGIAKAATHALETLAARER